MTHAFAKIITNGVNQAWNVLSSAILLCTQFLYLAQAISNAHVSKALPGTIQIIFALLIVRVFHLVMA